MVAIPPEKIEMNEIPNQEPTYCPVRVGEQPRNIFDRVIDMAIPNESQLQHADNLPPIIAGQQFPLDRLVGYAALAREGDRTIYTLIPNYRGGIKDAFRRSTIDVETTPPGIDGHVQVVAITKHLIFLGHNGVNRPLGRLDIIVEKPIPR